MINENILAGRTKNMGASIIREILKIANQPGVVSLAGGLPAPASFPLDIIQELTKNVIEKYADKAFQYSLTEGFEPLREQISHYIKRYHITETMDNIFISSGSQGVLDALGKIFISEGDKIAVEAPTYLGAIQAFNPYLPQYIRMETDDEGLIPESMEEVIRNHELKFVYLVPTFQNPTGRTISLERRKQIAEIIQKHNVLLIEDDPYGGLRYRNEHLPTIKSMAPEHVVYMGSFSKIFAPGLRLGFYIAPKIINRWLVLCKQSIDLHTSTLNQALASEYISGGYLDRHIPKIIDLYRPRQEAMIQAMDNFFPENFHYSRPDGGMFIWAEGPDSINIDKIYEEGIEEKVAFVPGKYFYTEKGDGSSTMRLNFTMSDENTIRSAIEGLSKVIKRNL
ncbi:MAG: PLP-dependent aminotransferase family protein [Spirochaetes bacterium]|nr:PLP-dependent aminotransferase family protein [Spirochaetota bacterium]